MEERKWNVELTEHQLMLMAECVEDCHRFLAGQTELSNTTKYLEHTGELWDGLNELQPLITPDIDKGASLLPRHITCTAEYMR